MHRNKSKLFEHLTSIGLLAADALAIVRIAYERSPDQPKVVFICHPIGGNVQLNLLLLREVIRKMHHKHPDVVPFCPYYSDVVALGESPQTRGRGLRSTRVLLQSGLVDEVWFTGPYISEGMKEEGRWARDQGLPVINMIGKL